MTLVFVLVVSLTLFISNSKLKSNDVNISDSKDNKIYLAMLLGSITFDLVMSKIPSIRIPLITYLVVGIGEIVFCIIVNAKREKDIKKRHSLIKQIVQCLAPVRKGNKLDEDIDSHLEENLGFELKFGKNGDLEEIFCEIDDPTKWTDDIITRIVFNLNKFVPTKQWVSHADFQKLECRFEGTKLPPKIAKYPGSFLRPNNFIPLGVNGVGELGWNLGTKAKEVGDSLFKYEDGTFAQTIIPAKAPQAIVGGSPLSLNTIIPTTKGYKTMGTIEVGDVVFGLDNKKSKVVEVHDIKKSKVYELTFETPFYMIKVISDGVHRFPIVNRVRTGPKDVDFFEPVRCEDLKIGNCVFGGNRDLSLIKKKKKLFKENVRCITVDSDEHIFKIVEKADISWNGGDEYNLPSLFTYNTGGGKAIVLDQKVKVLEN